MNRVSFLDFKTLPQAKRMPISPCFGGKGNGLIRIHDLDIPIPDTVLFDLNTLDQWLEKTLPVYRSVLDSCARWAIPQAQRALLKFRENGMDLISARGIPIDFDKMRKTLGEGEWIVRSSMSVEDSDTSSFSGCFESVRVSSKSGKDGLSRACLEVFFSAFQESPMIRVLSEGKDPRDFRSGFLIQKYISRQLGGVCLTRDPSQIWNQAQGLVEWGGEQVRPNRLAKRRDSSPTELSLFWKKLWDYSDAIESTLGGPSEWEWAWDGESLWVLQAQLIATAEAKLVAQTRKDRKWSREYTLERFPQPLTPMGWSALQDVFLTNLRSLEKRFGIIVRHPQDVAIHLNGVIYSDPDFFRFPKGIKICWSHYLTPYRRAFWTLGARVFLGSLRLFSQKNWKIKKALVKLSILDALMDEQSFDIEKNWEMHRDQSLSRMERFQKGIQTNRSQNPLEILARIETLKKLSQECMEPDLALFLIKESYYKVVQELWVALGRNSSQLNQAMRISNRKTTLETNQEWEGFLGTLRLEPVHAAQRFLQILETSKGHEQTLFAAAGLSSKAKQAWQSFLSKNGHLRTSWDVAVPSWGESPSELVPLLRMALQKPSHKVLSMGQNSASSAYTQICHDIGQDLQRYRLQRFWRLIEKSLRRVESFMKMDEEQQSLAGVLLDPTRDLILSAANILVSEKLLEQTDDVFFMELDELKEQLIQGAGSRMSQKFVTQKRRSEWSRACEAKIPFELAHLSEVQVQGLPVSPGEADGLPAVPEVETASDRFLPGMEVHINKSSGGSSEMVELLDKGRS